jgi:hypothetical protein
VNISSSSCWRIGFRQVEAVRAAEGWGGDNFTYYEQGNDYLFTWSIAWDSAADALEFSIAFQTMMSAVGAEEENQNLWEKYDRYISLKWEDTSTIIIGSTNKTLVQKIMACA